MAERPAARRHDGVRRQHAANVLRARGRAQQDHSLAGGGHRRGAIGIEHGDPVGMPRRRADPLGQCARRRQRSRLERRPQQSLQLFHRNLLQRRSGAHDVVVNQLGGNAHCSLGGPLRRPYLEKVELVAFDREFDVDRIAVHLLQALAVLVELAPMLVAQRTRLADRHRRGCARHQILALAPQKELAIEFTLTGIRVAGERDTGTRAGVEISEHHGLDRHRGTQVVGDLLVGAVGARAPAVP